ncbi:Kinase superfamily protein, putative isoform 1 [Hibiscus syriacus]|uniref:Kinase superfamily protein, putative isoform 1 n=1 Tax=Hibiscus syriacus TaxID=106335 RepID=A0A6A2WES1_HIBSY|nr:Kinase superfamily protein, putative isoform 1 [Hibiscus syriacus]
MFLAMHDIPKKIFTKIRYRNRADFQAKRHFVLGAQLLAQARSSKSRSSTASLAQKAEFEAEKAISLDPKDAASYILKASLLTFRLQDLRSRLPRCCSLPSCFQRGSRVDSAIDDLTKAVELGGDNAKVFCLLGDCYEMKKMKAEARAAFEEALKVEPTSSVARAAIDRLGS